MDFHAFQKTIHQNHRKGKVRRQAARRLEVEEHFRLIELRPIPEFRFRTVDGVARVANQFAFLVGYGRDHSSCECAGTAKETGAKMFGGLTGDSLFDEK